MDVPDARREPLTFDPPDAPGVCVGWRGWTVVETSAGPRLASPMRGLTVWPPDRALVAHCTIRGHGVPGPSCTCGLYAVHDPTQVAWVVPDRTVMGYVGLWGRVVEGERGWRASHGFPLMLLCPPTMPTARRRRLAEAYRVPVVPLPRGLDRLACLDDDRVRDLAEAVRLHAQAPTPTLAHRIDELADAVTAAALEERPAPRESGSRWARLARGGCRLLDAVVCLTVLVSILLTAAVARPAVERVASGVTALVGAVPGWAVALGWASAATAVLLREVVIGPSLRTLRRQYPCAAPVRGVRPVLLVVRVGFAVVVFAMSWMVMSWMAMPSTALPVSRLSLLPAPFFTVVALVAAGALLPALARHRAPRMAFRDPAAPCEEPTLDLVEVSTAEAWSAAHRALSAAQRRHVTHRPAR